MSKKASYYFKANLNNLLSYFEISESEDKISKAPAFPKKVFFLLFALMAIAAVLIYSNHFENTFHFDDAHTVVNNIYIQSIKNIPLFFKDGTTFSSLPSNQSYRPLVTTTLAIDFWLGGGLKPFYFHLSTFVLFIVQGMLMGLLFWKIFCPLLAPSPKGDVLIAVGGGGSAAALFGTAWYLFHPANAETINYVIARGDSLSTLFIVLAFVLYMYSGRCRKFHLYLIPVAIGMLAKVPAVMFGPILFVYILLFEKKIPLTGIFKKKHFPALLASVKQSLPSLAFCTIGFFFLQKMEPETWVGGVTSRYEYLITQPYVILHYFKTFFFPLSLSADTDWVVFGSIFSLKAILGFIFVAVLFSFAIVVSRYPKLRPVSFGIFWFFLALAPSSSVVPLSEVMNDHRIFFPYVGLAGAVTWFLYLILTGIKKEFSSLKKYSFLLAAGSLVFLSAYAYGTRQRNQVWRTDETLWYDVTVKSPNNARGLMNYGLVLMAKADYKGAEKYFLKALDIWPYYSYLHINIAILKSATGFPQEAEQHFKKSISLRGDLPESYYYYAQFLYKHKRTAEAVQMLEKTLQLSQAHSLARYLLMAIYFDSAEFDKLEKLANETLGILPNDPQAIYFLNAKQGKKSKLDIAEETARTAPSADNYINLSLEYYYAGKYKECIAACREALKLKPDSDLAYNNICSANNMLGEWDEAIAAGQKAVQLNPSSQLAKNNLQLAITEKEKQGKK